MLLLSLWLFLLLLSLLICINIIVFCFVSNSSSSSSSSSSSRSSTIITIIVVIMVPLMRAEFLIATRIRAQPILLQRTVMQFLRAVINSYSTSYIDKQHIEFEQTTHLKHPSGERSLPNNNEHREYALYHSYKESERHSYRHQYAYGQFS